MEENMSCKASSGVDNASIEGLDPNISCYPAYPSKHSGHCSKESVNKLKGIMPQLNGNWGSQMYANGHQIGLGTVKSEKEEEMACDSTAIRLRYGGSRQNFPWTNVIAKEPNFQSQQHGQEAVLEMISGGSWQPRFQGLHGANNYGNTESGICGLNLSAMQKRGGFSCKLLFRKMLTQSDVGRLNRLVIPKKHATTCFSEISRRMEEYAKAGIRADEQVDFFDRTMTTWKFRYCYWKSSQSYVFTRGWIKFVRENRLNVNDVVAFYSCEVQREGKIVNKFFMIDPERGEGNYASSGRSVIEDANHNNVGLKSEMGSSFFEGCSYHHHHHHHHHHHVEVKSEVCSDNDEKRLGKRVMMDVNPPSNVERKGFRLFGVQIN